MRPSHILHLGVRGYLWAHDKLRNGRFSWEAAAICLFARYLLKIGPLKSRLFLLAGAYRRTSFDLLRRLLEKRLAPWLRPSNADIWRRKKIGWTRYQRDITHKTLNKSLILKPPGHGGEKGVLYVSFELNWLRLLEHFDVRQLLDQYFFVGASSSSPPEFRAHWAFAHLAPEPIFCQVSNLKDVSLHRRLPHNICCLPLMACDWVNPAFYVPKPHDTREIDVLMVAGWSRVKRHWLLFRALRKMRSNLRVVLIGQDMDGRTADDVFREAESFGVAQRLEIIRDAPVEVVSEHQCNSRVSIALSRREGSCVAVTESFFADAPVAMVDNAHIGSQTYINSQTGVLLDSNVISWELSRFIEESSCYSPRAWAMQRILRAYAEGRGSLWSQDIRPLCWRPDPVYVHPDDALAMAPAYEQLYTHHGIAIQGHDRWHDVSCDPKP